MSSDYPNYSFNGILNKIKNSTHPEEYHKKNGNHPGSNWYLKTVSPIPDLIQVDEFGFGLLWQTLSDEYPELIKLVTEAYDWNGVEIQNMVSIWLDQQIDIILGYDHYSGVSMSIISRDEGIEHYTYVLKHFLTLSKESLMARHSKSKTIKDVDTLLTNLKLPSAKEIKLKVLKGGKKKKK